MFFFPSFLIYLLVTFFQVSFDAPKYHLFSISYFILVLSFIVRYLLNLMYDPYNSLHHYFKSHTMKKRTGLILSFIVALFTVSFEMINLFSLTEFSTIDSNLYGHYHTFVVGILPFLIMFTTLVFIAMTIPLLENTYPEVTVSISEGNEIFSCNLMKIRDDHIVILDKENKFRIIIKDTIQYIQWDKEVDCPMK